MFAISNHITNYKITQEDLNNGFFDFPFNSVKFRFSLDKTEFDATQTLFNYDVANKLTSASINAVNTFLRKEFKKAIREGDLFKWKDDGHLWISIRFLDIVMFKYDNFGAVSHLLDNDPKWQDYKRGFIYIIYLKKAKKYVMVAKGGKTDGWYGRIKNYEHTYGKENVIVVAIFYVQYTSPAEQLLLKTFADNYGTPLKFSNQEDTVGGEYYQIKDVESDEDAIEALLHIGDLWVKQMPGDELIAEWWLNGVADELWETISRDYETDRETMLDMIDAIESQKRPAKYLTEALKLLEKLCSDDWNERSDGADALFAILKEISINEFILECDPDAKVSKSRLPLEVL